MIHEAPYYIRFTGSFRVACPFNFARARCFNLQFTFTFLLLPSCVAMDSLSVGGQGVSKRNSRVSCMVFSWGVIFWTPRTHFGRSNLRTRFGIGNAGSVTEPYSRRWVALLQIYQLNVIDKHVGQHQSCSVAKVLRSLVTAQSASNHFSSSTSDI